MVYRVEFKPSAYKKFSKLPTSVQRAIAGAIGSLQTDPRPPGVVKLSGEMNLYRIRVREFGFVISESFTRFTTTSS